MTRESVAIVVDRDAGPHLKVLVQEHYLWVIYSVANRRVVEEIWNEAGNEPDWRLASIMSRKDEAPSLRVEMEAMIDEAILHIPFARRMHLVGVPVADQAFADAAMLERGLRPDDCSLEFGHCNMVRDPIA